MADDAAPMTAHYHSIRKPPPEALLGPYAKPADLARPRNGFSSRWLSHTRSSIHPAEFVTEIGRSMASASIAVNSPANRERRMPYHPCHRVLAPAAAWNEAPDHRPASHEPPTDESRTTEQEVDGPPDHGEASGCPPGVDGTPTIMRHPDRGPAGVAVHRRIRRRAADRDRGAEPAAQSPRSPAPPQRQPAGPCPGTPRRRVTDSGPGGGPPRSYGAGWAGRAGG